MARKPRSIDPVGSPQEDAETPLAVLPVAQETAPEPKARPAYSISGDLRSISIECTRHDIDETAKAIRHFVAGIVRNRHTNHADGALGQAIASLDALARIVPTMTEGE
jgi:hypothetical protein